MNWNKYLAITAVFLTAIGIAFAGMVWKVNEMAESDCQETLQQEVKNLSEDIEKHILSDREQLEVVADILSGYENLDCEEVKNILKSYETRSVISRIYILLPDNTVLLKDGSNVDVNGSLSFDEEASHGVHISGKEIDLLEGKEVLRHFVPIVRDGETIGILYGVMELERLPEFWTANAFGGKMSVYLVERKTGDFLMDTWRNELGNIFEKEYQELGEGYDEARLWKGIMEGEEGYCVLSSKENKENLHFYNAPLAVNHWMLAISIQETAVFQNAAETKAMLYLYGGFVVVCFVIYFIGLFWYRRKETNEEKQRLEMVNYIYDVEKTLFSAYRTEDYAVRALEKIGEMTTAEAVFLKIFDLADEGKLYLWCREEERRKELTAALEENSFFKDNFLEESKSLIWYGTKDQKAEDKKIGRMIRTTLLSGVMAAKIEDVSGKLIGVLGAVNMKEYWKTPVLLENVTLSFSMFYNNMRSFKIIKEMGENDLLTGLLNRNSYQKRIQEYPKQYKKSLACIYADANGLHELNNSQGHEAGDKMLQCVAGLLQKNFGIADTYRIGGDEFVAFDMDSPKKEILDKIKEIDKELERHGYHISVGVQWEQQITSMDDLVREAEQQMYGAKRSYYEQMGRDRRVRN